MKRITQMWNHSSISYVFFRFFTIAILTLLFETILVSHLHAQSEVMAWGNLTGIRVEGQLMEFESSLRVVEKGWRNINATDRHGIMVWQDFWLANPVDGPDPYDPDMFMDEPPCTAINGMADLRLLF